MADAVVLEGAESTSDLLHLMPPLAAAGPTVRYVYGGLERILLNEPDEIRQVVSDPRREFPALGVLQRVLGQGLLAADDLDIWAPHRSVIQRGFSPRQVTAYAQRIEAVTRRLVESWSPGRQVSVRDEMSEWSLDNVGDSVFGDDFTSFREAIRDQFRRTIHQTLAAMADIEAGTPKPGAEERLEQTITELEETVRHIAGRRQNGIVSAHGLIDRMIEASQDGDPRYADPFIRDEVITMMFAGYDTLAVTASLSLFLLYTHPPVLERVRSEAAEARSAGIPVERYMKDLPYIRAVIHETLRLYPSIPFYHRPALEDRRVGGEWVKKGTILTASAWVTQRNPEYFPDPLTFDPDRWSPERRAAVVRNSYFPFGQGVRNCVGTHFSMLALAIVVAEVASTVDLIFEDEQPAVQANPTMHVANAMMATVGP
jgi:cytochrome P450